MVGAEESAYLKAVKSRQTGGKLGTAKFGDLVNIGVAVAEGSGDGMLVDLMEGFRERGDTHLYRREMFYAMRSALRSKAGGQSGTLSDAIWSVQNRIRHAGRQIARRSIGSTLLVKGLEFDHSVVVHANNMSRNDWYVALTRATKGLTILSPSQTIVPARRA
jgi:DNA helicase-2/ATP-dependent DNA helicase PcrA